MVTTGEKVTGVGLADLVGPKKEHEPLIYKLRISEDPVSAPAEV